MLLVLLVGGAVGSCAVVQSVRVQSVDAGWLLRSRLTCSKQTGKLDGTRVASKSSQQPRAAKSSQPQPRAARSSQEQPRNSSVNSEDSECIKAGDNKIR